jgi:uncharacterized membrane protein
MRIITHSKHAVNISQAERIVSAIGGGILAAAGLKKRSAAGVALAVIGGDLLRRGITGHSFAYEAMGVRTADAGQGWETTSVPYELGVRVDKSITIAKPPREVYAFWREFSNLSKFMKNVEAVTEIDDQHSHWVVTAPAGRGTEVKVELQYNPPAGALGAVFASLWGKEPSQQIQEDLHRLKAMLEAGEIPTTEGQPTGKAEHEHHGGKVTEASEESFPASDAPAYNH